MRSHDRTVEAHPLRDTVLAVVLGAGAGVVALAIVAVFTRTLVPGPDAATGQGVWLWFTIGLAVSNVYSMQLEAFPAGRLAFALPAVVAFLWEQSLAARRHRRELGEPT